MAEESKEKTFQALKKIGKPATTDAIAFTAGVGWETARQALMELLVEKRISGLKTTRSWIFWPLELEVHAPKT